MHFAYWVEDEATESTMMVRVLVDVLPHVSVAT
ncbi:MAG: hypothetical protein QOE55_5774 [Acidobacteriaceae bacterium]|jgi:hypothetical protein|nr:hypothetical protein [Acidobacteriaceae bacterium]